MTEREKMLAGQLYDCGDAGLLAQWHKAKDLIRDYNQTDSADMQKKDRILGELLGGKGQKPCRFRKRFNQEARKIFQKDGYRKCV